MTDRPDDDTLIAEFHRQNLAARTFDPPSAEELVRLRVLAAAVIEWRAQFYKPAAGRRVAAMLEAVDALVACDHSRGAKVDIALLNDLAGLTWKPLHRPEGRS